MKGPHHVGLDKVLRAVDGTIHMTLSRKVNHRPWPVLIQELSDQCLITDIPLHEDVSWIVFYCGKVLEVTGVGKEVQVNNRLLGPADPPVTKIISPPLVLVNI